MLRFIKASAVCAVLGIGALAGAPAQADALYVGTGHHGGVSVVVRDHDGGRWHNRPVPRCTADRAVAKARRMGVRHAYVSFANRSMIGVKGQNRRGTLFFGRAANCPLVR